MKMDFNMLYETFVRAIEQVKTSLVNDDNPKVAIVIMERENEVEFTVIGEIGAVMTLDDGRIGLVLSKTTKAIAKGRAQQGC